MRRTLNWIKEEIILAIPAIIFFVITFNLINFTERLMLRPYHLKTTPASSYLAATIGALIVGKVILVVNSIPYVDLFRRKPLIYNISWKFFIYGSITLAFRILEDYLHALLGQGDFSYADTVITAKLTSPLFWAIQMWVWMLFIVYLTSTDIIRAMGKKKFNQLLFGK